MASDRAKEKRGVKKVRKDSELVLRCYYYYFSVTFSALLPIFFLSRKIFQCQIIVIVY